MAQSKADLILHPVRMRILLELAGGERTAGQLATALSPVASATLYRHLHTLVQAGFLTVVSERPVRGTVEKIYALHGTLAPLTAADLPTASTDDHLRYFTTFLTALLRDFTGYLAGPGPVDPGADGVRYHKGHLYLSDPELTALQEATRTLLLPLLTNAPSSDRRRRIFATILLPAPAEAVPDTPTKRRG